MHIRPRTWVIGLIAVLNILILVALIGIEPKDRRPGTRLAGELMPLPVDWTLTNAFDEVHVQTKPWYGIPFSVTTVVAAGDGALYVPSIYAEPAPFPGTKYWNTVVASNPNVILRVGNKLFELAAYPITDPTEFDTAFRALASKYDFWGEALVNRDKRPNFILLKLVPRAAP